MRRALPQPYRELDHTADLGLEVEGASAEETLARLVLALSATMAGGGDVARDRFAELAAEPSDRVTMAVDVLRAQLLHFATRREIVSEVEVVAFDSARGAKLRCALGAHDPVRHEEGGEIKAITLHDARFERSGAGWVARVILDV